MLLARRENGLAVYDTASQAAPVTIPGTEGANAAAVAPSADRIYVASMDGSVIVVRASDRHVLSACRWTPATSTMCCTTRTAARCC
ncbi:hypothetical protein WJ968_04765 [Achromobacter xylosoxidans]